ncbi:MAG: hypothetical protein LBU22_03665 [Dysgonamonadaceae bacterium]|jgi:hypothetical protein|nr:hypothetical protein [Dysgonamonadaceae bacterium]
MKQTLKKGIVLLLLCVVSASSVSAQFLNSSNQQLIEEAVKNGFFIIHRTYQLQDTTAATPAYYTWNDAPGFGDSYSLAVKTTTGYYVHDKAAHPWLYDSKFEEYRDSRQYAPVISASEYKQAGDSAYISLSCNDCETEAIVKNKVYLIRDSLFENKGFSVDYSNGTKKGWLVWAVSDKPMEEQHTQTLSLLIYRAELLFETGKELYEIQEPASNKSISGGFYVVPEFDEIGQIRFRLTGLLHKENDHWQVVRPGSDKVKLEPVPEKVKEQEKGKGKKGLTLAPPPPPKGGVGG